MDDLLIQEEITIKTEPSALDGNMLLSNSFKKDDLMFLKCGFENVPHEIRSKITTDKDTDYLFIDPDGAVDHYEEVLEGQSTTTLGRSKDVISEMDENFEGFQDMSKGQKESVCSRAGCQNNIEVFDRREKCVIHRGCISRSSLSYADGFSNEDSLVNGKGVGMFTRSPKKSTLSENDLNKLSTDFTLECSFCMFTTPVEKVMKNHMLQHIDSMDLDAFVEVSQSEDAYKCLFCPFSSVSSDMFKYHLKFKHVPSKDTSKSTLLKPEEIFESDDDEMKDESPDFKGKNNIMLNCKNCSYVCNEIEEMNEHLTKLHPDTLLKCPECAFATLNKSAYKIHLETHSSEVKAYSCSRCNFSTSRRDAYLQHKVSHAEAKQFTCNICGFEAKTKQSFLKHRDKHLRKHTKLPKKNIIRRNEGVFSCDECNFQARTRQGFNKHKEKHFRKLKAYPEHCFIKTEEDKYACDECSFEARTLQGYNKHKEKHYRKSGSFQPQYYDTNNASNIKTEDDPYSSINYGPIKIDSKYVCAECNFATITLQGFNKHKGRHLRLLERKVKVKEEVPSPSISKITESSMDLNVSENTKSQGANKFKCDECLFETTARQALLKHKDKHYRNRNLSTKTTRFVSKPKSAPTTQGDNKGKYSCSECTFQGKTVLGLIKHKKSHHGKNVQEFPFNCTFCHYRATKRSHLARHEMIHTGERPFECPHCDYKCNQASTLKVHVRRHTGEMPYSCYTCPFKTFSTCLLKSHLKKHVTPKGSGFTCNTCHQIYSTELALKKHEQIHTQPNLVVRRRRRTKLSSNESVNLSMEAPMSPEVKHKIPETISYSPPLTGLYQCSICDYQCNKFVQLTEHTISHKNGTFKPDNETHRKKYFCEECNLHFARKKEIKSHYKATHPGESYQKNR